MTLTLSSTAIREAAALFRRISGKSTLPILNSCRVTVPEDSVAAILEVTDLDIHLIYRCTVGGPTTPGCFMLPRKDLAAIAKAADKGTPVRLDLDLANPVIPKVNVILFTKNMRTTLTLVTLPPKEFPAAPSFTDAEPPVILPSQTLSHIRKVHACASEDATRYVLNGVFISRYHGGAIVATDGRRMALIEGPVPVADAIIPNTVVALLADATCQTPAVLTRDADLASLAFGTKTTLIFKLIQGNFPNYRQVIPHGRNGSATFPEPSLPAITSWLRQYPGETICLTFGPGNIITFEVFRPDQGQFSTQALAIMNGEPPAKCAYNASFLADGLAMGLHTIDLIDEMSPAILTDGLVRYVLMPMRTTGAAAPVVDASGSNSEPEEEPAAEDADPADPSDDEEPAIDTEKVPAAV